MKPIGLGVSALIVLALYSIGRADSFELGPHRFMLPPGFTIELAAEPPLVDRPMMADFDERGRLYVADSSGSNEDVNEQLKTKPHRIVRLEDTDGDGMFDRRTVFADRMMFPEGVLYYRGSVYVSAPPSIWRLTDTDGDGISDTREEWHEGKTLTGCANDLHGPYLGRDGWIYWCKGAFAEQSYPRPNQSPFVSRASHIFRRHPEQPWVESVMTGGMDNPVEVVFSAEGERIFTTTFLQHPGGGRRDGIIHAIYGGLYGKEHGVLDGHPRTGDLMPVMAHTGAAATCGLALKESDSWGESFQHNLFATQFNLRKVTRHHLTAQGASFESADSDFLVSDQLDFHPTDVLEDADGSLLVIDTGGWYKICCPTSQLPKPEVLGAIYRIRNVDAPAGAAADPRGLHVNWNADAAELVTRLEDNRHAVRDRAIDTLASIGVRAIPQVAAFLQRCKSVTGRQAAIWTLTSIDGPEAREAIRPALEDPDPGVRQAATHAAAVWRDEGALEKLCANLRSPHPALQRTTAEALGRLGSKEAIADLVLTLESVSPEDRILEHSLLYALIEIARPEFLEPYLSHESATVQRGVFIALDQMNGDAATPEMAIRLARSEDEALRATARRAMAAHPEWASSLTSYLTAALRSGDRAAKPLLSSLVSHEDVQRLCASELAHPRTAETVLEALASASISNPSEALFSAVHAQLKTPNRSRALRALERMLSSKDIHPPGELTESLIELAQDPESPPDDRLRALCLTRSETLPDDLLAFALDHLLPAKPLAMRSLALRSLTAAKPSSAQVPSLIAVLTRLAPMETAQLLPVIAPVLEAGHAQALVAALENHPHRAAIPPSVFSQMIDVLPPEVRQEAHLLGTSLTGDRDRQLADLESLMETLPPGDVLRGQAVFNSDEAACITCHEIGYRGGSLGPDLTSIGQTRSERDLLEAIVFPSLSFVRSYETVTVSMRDGSQFLGIVRSETEESLILTLAPETEVIVQRSEIAGIQPAAISLMPQGLNTQISDQALADLLAFLKNTKWR